MRAKRSNAMSTKTIDVKYLARVEGEGALRVEIKNKKVVATYLKIFEPPRFFEAFLRGRKFDEAPDITSRICGICPIAYQTSAMHAMEDVCQFVADPMTESLRRLIYLGEWIESHSLHVYMLHAPDFLGFESGIHMAKVFPEEVRRGLALKKIGNELMSLLGGREVHPINLKVGGFYRYPTKEELIRFRPQLEKGLEMAIATLHWVSKFDFPKVERDYEFVCLRPPQDLYPVESGRIISSKGLNIEADEYEDHFEEIHVPHSTALHSNHRGYGSYVVGPLSRFHLSYERLGDVSKAESQRVKFSPTSKNPFKSILARSVELIYACEEGIRLIDHYEVPDESVRGNLLSPKKRVGYACTEAPRGMLYHRYHVSSDGLIEDAKIVAPTSQNQRSIEEDLFVMVQDRVSWSKDKLTWFCEQAVRNYDPCISCSAHFLKVSWVES